MPIPLTCPARMRWAGQALGDAAGAVVAELGQRGGSGGLIAVDRDGNVALPFNSPGMYRAWCGQDGVIHTAIFGRTEAEPLG